MKTLSGISLSPGIAEGPLHVHRPETLPTPPCEQIKPSEVETELRLLRNACTQTRIDLELTQERLAANVDSVAASHIFHAHLHMLADPTWIHEIERRIREEKICAPAAVHRVTLQFAERFEAMENPYLAEKAIDLRDVARRLLSHLDPRLTLPIAQLKEPSIVVAKAMMPSDMVHLDRKNTLAIVTEEGGVADHVAIVTRALGIPGVTGVRNVTQRLESGHHAIVDGARGRLVVDASESTRSRYRQQAKKLREEREALAALRDEPAITSDGQRVHLWANVGDIEDVRAARAAGAEAIGLFRTELAFLTSAKHPTEAQQIAAYRQMAEEADGLVLTVRTLDLGGDKLLLYEGNKTPEANPLLGLRGIRRSLNEPKIFRRQLRALLRLAADFEIRLLVPMVVSVSDVIRAREEIKLASAELKRAKQRHRADVPLGIMVETPAAVLILEDLLPHVDFVSVGTNDLIQYMLVADRQDSRLRADYTLYHPAVIRALETIARVCIDNGKPPCLCGELAGFEAMTELLLGMGYTTLSMAPSEIPTVKRRVGTISLHDAFKLAKRTLKHGMRSDIESDLLKH